MPVPDGLSRRIATGTMVNYLGFFAGKLIVFVNTVVLARLLAPEHFGLVAIGLMVLAVSETIFEAGTGSAVVWRPGDMDETASVALSIGLAGAMAMAGAVVVLAPAIADFFGDAQAVEIIRVLAICALLSSPASIFSSILLRRLQFARRMVPEFARSIVKGAVGIPLALLGFGAWSLVWGHIAALVVGLALVWWLSGWRPRLSLKREVVRDVLPYGIQIALIGLLGLATKRLDVVIVGWSFETAALGVYTLAFSLIELVILGICWSASQAFFPALSRTAQDGERLRLLLGDGLGILFMVVVPVAVALAVMAEPFILTFYGAKWIEAVLPMQALAFYALIVALGFNLGDVYKAIGRPQVLTWINLVNLALAAPILLVAARWGLWGVALGQVVVATAITAVNWAVARHVVGIGVGVLARAVKAPLLAAMTMAAACIATDWLLLDGIAPAGRLAVLASLGAASYCGTLLLLVPNLPGRLRGALKQRAAAAGSPVGGQTDPLP